MIYKGKYKKIWILVVKSKIYEGFIDLWNINVFLFIMSINNFN